jgi:hypothetical protein
MATLPIALSYQGYVVRMIRIFDSAKIGERACLRRGVFCGRKINRS